MLPLRRPQIARDLSRPVSSAVTTLPELDQMVGHGPLNQLVPRPFGFAMRPLCRGARVLVVPRRPVVRQPHRSYGAGSYEVSAQ
jgi:hypothetical protein